MEAGLKEAFEQGAAVTAKVIWTPKVKTGSDAAEIHSSTKYISCTPLLGSDDQIGVWMVVLVDTDMIRNLVPPSNRPTVRTDSPSEATLTPHNTAKENAKSETSSEAPARSVDKHRHGSLSSYPRRTSGLTYIKGISTGNVVSPHTTSLREP